MGVIHAARPLISVGLAGLGLGGHVGEMLGGGVVDALRESKVREGRWKFP
jgi:hypothetical protein